MNKNKEIIILIAILALGLFLRFYTLGDRSFWGDEVNLMRMSRLPFLKYIVDRTRDLDPPLGILPNYISYHISGKEFVARFVSAIFGASLIYFIYILASMLFNKGVGVISAILYAFHPLGIYYSHDARYYTIFAVFYILSVYYFFKLLDPDTQNKNNWIKFAIFLALSIYTHIFTILNIAIFAILFLCVYWNNKKVLIRMVTAISLVLLIGAFVNVYIFATSGNVFLKTGGFKPGLSNSAPQLFFRDCIVRIYRAFFVIIDQYKSNNELIEIGNKGTYNNFFLVAVITMLIGIFYGIKKEYKKVLILVGLVNIPIIILFFVYKRVEDIYAIRRMFFLLPLIIVLVSKGIYDLSYLIKKYILSKVNITVISIILLMVIFAKPFVMVLVPYYSFKENARWRPDWNGASKYVLSNINENDVIVFNTEPSYYMASYYIEENSGIREKRNFLPIKMEARFFSTTLNGKNVIMVPDHRELKYLIKTNEIRNAKNIFLINGCLYGEYYAKNPDFENTPITMEEISKFKGIYIHKLKI